MALGIHGKSLVPNPELEVLRDRGLNEDNKALLNDATRQLIQKTARIHAGFLFEAPKTLQNLLLYICEAQDSIADPGWKSLGHELGLSVSVLMAIKNHNLSDQDPAYNTLLAYAQQDEATVGKVVESLHTIGRLDIISRMQQQLHELAEKVTAQYETVNGNTEESNDFESSDYGSLQSSQEGLTDIIKPHVLPSSPFILKNIKIAFNDAVTIATGIENNPHTISRHVTQVPIQPYTALPCTLVNHSPIRTQEVLVNRANKEWTGSTDSITKAKNKVYGKKILLTFAMDGEKMVKKTCEVLRRQRPDFGRIGVVVLSEHMELVIRNPQQFITGAFYQVDYVCPILTPGYMRIITGKGHEDLDMPSTTTHIDACYAKYIFTLMNSYYISNGCINDKIRCIIPDDYVTSMQNNLLLSGPIFASWTRFTDIEDLAVNLLKSNK